METKSNRFEAETLNEGIDAYSFDMTSVLHFGLGLKNVTNAQKEGLTPRYGMAPIPGQSHTDAQIVVGGLMNSEGATYSYQNREKVFSCLPIQYGTFDDINVTKQHYIWVCSSEQASVKYIDFAISAERDVPTSTTKYKGDIAGGLTYDTPGALNFCREIRIRDGKSGITDYKEKDYSDAYLSATTFTKSGKLLRKKYWYGFDDSSYPDSATRFSLPVFGGNYGTPYPINTGKYKKGSRAVRAYSIKSLSMEYRYDYDAKVISADSFTPKISNDILNTCFVDSDWGAVSRKTNRDDGVTPAHGTSDSTLYVDSEMTMNSGYTAVLAAADKAFCALMQEAYRGSDDLPFQYCDLSRSYLFQEDIRTIDNLNGAVEYREESREKTTCWNTWCSVDATRTWTTPTRASIETALGRVGTGPHTCLGAANTGILRANRTYEFTYSLYDYSTDYECNVGTAALVRTDSTDNVCLYLWLQPTVSGGAPVSGANEYKQECAFKYASATTFNVNIQTLHNIPINYLEYRVYYREVGTFEWLPAGRIEYSRFAYDPDLAEYAVCTGTETGLPGGQPGAFNDYSELPDDNWNEVISFNNRIFWFSKSQVQFSNQDNVFAYAARNNFPCPKGEFRGGIIHTFYGESEQTGRVVFFGSEETYFGEFTDVFINQPVRVSTDSVATFPLDGSNFVVKLRSTITAFSSRAAIVANGMLYFWGQDGIFEDNGVLDPQKISNELEPDLFDFYDQNSTRDIFANYNSNTKEIIWYYTPKDTSDGLTGMLVYNIKSRKWLAWNHEKKIDWARPLKIDNEDVATAKLVAGPRQIIGVRENAAGTISRSVFFDHFNKCPDFTYGTEFLVNQVTNPSGTTYRFILASGFDAALLAGVGAGDLFSTPNMREYSEQATADTPRAIWEVTATGVNYVEANLVSGTTMFTATLSDANYFPIYFEEIHGYDWVIETNKWAPNGVRYFITWVFYHLIWFVDLLVSDDSQTITVGYKGNLPDYTYKDRVIQLENNSDDFCQRMDQTIPENEVHFGQSIQTKLSGTYLGGVYALQYLAWEGIVRPEFGHTQRFESE